MKGSDVGYCTVFDFRKKEIWIQDRLCEKCGQEMYYLDESWVCWNENCENYDEYFPADIEVNEFGDITIY
jgi:hypothetical protein